MATTQLTKEELSEVDRLSNMYVEKVSGYRNWCPIKTIPARYYSTFYTVERAGRPEVSKDGRLSREVSVARAESTVNLAVLKYKFFIPRIEVEAARAVGYPQWAETLAVYRQQFEQEVSHLLYEGMSSPITIVGLRGGGTDVGATTDLNAVKWNTATSPLTHCAAAYGVLNTAGFSPPYTWALSSNLDPGNKALYGTGFAANHEALARDNYGVERIQYEGIGTTTQKNIYPLAPATGDDGIWFMTKPEMGNFRLVETGPPEMALDPTYDPEYDAFVAYMRWHGGVEIVHSTSIVHELEVDLA